MKKKYLCDICGKDFDTEKECEQHERNCSRVDALEKRVKELEDKVAILEKYVAIMNAPSYPSQPNYPNYPTVPNNPSSPPVWGCAGAEEKTVCNGSDEKSEKKADGKAEA